MDPQFPSNSRRPTRAEQRVEKREERKVERVVQSDVVRRKTPAGRRLLRNLGGGDGHSIFGWMFGDVLIPAARDTIAEALTGGIERAIFGDSGGGRRARRSGGPIGHTPYHRYAAPSQSRNEPRREISRKARASHSFDEIIIPGRAEAEEVLDRLDDMCARFECASVADLYELCGISGNWADDKWGWTDVSHATTSRVKGGYLLNLPQPEPID